MGETRSRTLGRATRVGKREVPRNGDWIRLLPELWHSSVPRGQMFCAGCGGSLAAAAKAIPAAAPAAFVPPPAPEAAPPPWASAAPTPPPYAPPPPVSGQAPWTGQPAPAAPAKSGANPILFLAVIALVVAVAGVGYVAMNGGSKGSPVPGGSGGPTATASVVATTPATPTTRPHLRPRPGSRLRFPWLPWAASASLRTTTAAPAAG